MTPHLADTPVLTTERLTLRAPVAADYGHFAGFAASDRARYIGGPYPPSRAWRGFGHVIGHWVLRGYGMFIFTLRGKDTPLGAAGPWFPETWPEREIGWSLWSADHEGKGLAFEAVARARDYVFADLGWDTAVSYIDAPNARSIALAERLGAARDDAAEPPVDDDAHGATKVLVYRHPVPQVTP